MSGNNKRKILFLNHWAKNAGGAEHSLSDIFEYAKDKFECHLVTSEKGFLTKSAEKNNITIHTIAAEKNISKITRKKIFLISPFVILSFVRYLLKVNIVYKKVKPDIIHANIPKSHILLLLLKKLGFSGCGVIHFREIYSSKFPYFIYTLLLSKNISIISISQAVENRLPKKLQKISSIIYNGITIPQKYKNAIPRNPIKLLYLGRVVPWKNIEALIKVLSIANNSNKEINFKLTICGDSIYGPEQYRKKISNYINKLHLDNCCRLLPSTKNISEIYLSNDIFVNASLDEPFGRVIAEAMAHALPVVAFDSAGVSEIVNANCGILIEPNNYLNFSDALFKVSNICKTKNTLGVQGRERTIEKFNRELQIKKIINYLLNLL